MKMTEQEFDTVVSERLEKTKIILIEKGKHYRRNQNPMHNFDIGANMTGQSREKVLYGFMLKHLISFQDIINDLDSHKLPTVETLEEKIGDLVNYLILAEASIKDKLFKASSLTCESVPKFSKELLKYLTKPVAYVNEEQLSKDWVSDLKQEQILSTKK